LPPSTLSLPGPPSRLSLKPFPKRSSWAPAPKRLSALLVPLRVSGPSVPTSLTARATPLASSRASHSPQHKRHSSHAFSHPSPMRPPPERLHTRHQSCVSGAASENFPSMRFVDKDSRKRHSSVGLYPSHSSHPCRRSFLLSLLWGELRMQTFEEALRDGVEEFLEGSQANDHPLAVGRNHVFAVGYHPVEAAAATD
jgi:hypothetical protein